MYQNRENSDAQESILSFPRLPHITPVEPNMGSRPFGSTNKAKKDLECMRVATTNLVTQTDEEARNAGNLFTYSYKGIHTTALEFHLLLVSGFSVNKTTVLRWIQ